MCADFCETTFSHLPLGRKVYPRLEAQQGKHGPHATSDSHRGTLERTPFIATKVRTLTVFVIIQHRTHAQAH